jgi:hypothetical protein
MTSDASAVSAELIEAYRKTEFRVLGSPQFTLRVGMVSQELRQLYMTAGAQSAAFVTAWNPYSTLTSADENRIAQSELLLRLSQDGFATMDGCGIYPTTEWAGEDSVLVLGISWDQTKELGNELSQNAVIWIGADAVPILVMLR